MQRRWGGRCDRTSDRKPSPAVVATHHRGRHFDNYSQRVCRINIICPPGHRLWIDALAVPVRSYNCTSDHHLPVVESSVLRSHHCIAQREVRGETDAGRSGAHPHRPARLNGRTPVGASRSASAGSAHFDVCRTNTHTYTEPLRASHLPRPRAFVREPSPVRSTARYRLPYPPRVWPVQRVYLAHSRRDTEGGVSAATPCDTGRPKHDTLGRPMPTAVRRYRLRYLR